MTEDRIYKLERRVEAAYSIIAILCAELDIKTDDALEILDILGDEEPKPLPGVNEFGNMEHSEPVVA